MAPTQKRTRRAEHTVKLHHIESGKTIHEITTISTGAGKILHQIIKPLRLEFHPQDVMQVIVGSTILAIPVSFTEEIWRLGDELPLANILAISIISVLFIGLFTFYTYYRHTIKKHLAHFIFRVITTYLLAFVVVGLLLILINKGPWATDWILALKRVVLVAFPASMSAAIADTVHSS